MTDQEHKHQAEEYAGCAYHYIYGDGADPVTGHAFAALAQAHATLALFDHVREIGDQLDTLPRHRPGASTPLEPPQYEDTLECCASGSCEVCRR